jgi:hypothetical protein
VISPDRKTFIFTFNTQLMKEKEKKKGDFEIPEEALKKIKT